MPKIKNYIEDLRHILLMWFVLFSFAPCTVKEVLRHSVTTDYAKPLNKSKTTTLTSSCFYSQIENQQISVVKKSKINKQIEPFDFSGNQYFAVHSAKVYGDYSKASSGNSPPKYILFKRLKIDVA